MDPIRTGNLICRLRTEQALTQRQLAELLHVSDKAVSKWETGKGCPDIGLLHSLADALGVSMETLLSGNYPEKERESVTMKNTKFYVCPTCGNFLTASSDAEVCCCGRKLAQTTPRKAEEHELLHMEPVDGEWFITSDHEMTKSHYIAFVAFLTDSTMTLSRQYPEWNLQVRLPYCGRGRLLWYCTRCGLLYQDIRVKIPPRSAE